MATIPESISRRLDVYARPFIQTALREVNDVPANVISSTSAQWIEFESYTSTFAGSDLMNQDTRLCNGSPDELVTSPSLIVDLKSTTNRAEEPDDDAPSIIATLSPTKYFTCYSTALDREEAAQQQECEDHALFQVPLYHHDAALDSWPFLQILRVPGLREMSLRIDIGDVVQLRQLRFDHDGKLVYGSSVTDAWGRPAPAELQKEIQHNAVVWGIDRRNETLRLRIDYLIPNSMVFNVRFTVQSYRIAAMRQALLTAHSSLVHGDFENTWMRTMLFPARQDSSLQKTLNRWETNVDFFDGILNYEQKKAVATITIEDYGTVPYIISGPPGTGKTKTIVELALQLLLRQRSAHILVCAPSDPASDTLVHRLRKHLSPGELLRLNSPGRSFPEVPDPILPYCFVDDGLFSLPPFAALMKTKIVVTTCRDADLLVKARVTNRHLFDLQQRLHSSIHPESNEPGITKLHWTGLLIDEAAQATEPEALIPMSVVAPPEWVPSSKLAAPMFVLAGDQHQLGPRSASREVEMQRSLLERLSTLSFYLEHPLARSKQRGGVMRPLTQEMLPICRPAFTDLIRNYRSHPSILAVPSRLFYHDTLEPEAHYTDNLSSWPGWRGRGWPVLLAVNTAIDEVEPDDGGSFNVTEARMACHYARSFIDCNAVRPEDIAIISPYRAQVLLLRKIARSPAFSMFGVNIGPLEAFQGLESRVVILCTTRTRDRFVEQDRARGLGVIHEPRRFNVALTRAKQALVVIGNPSVLAPDEYWHEFMRFCWRNGLWHDQNESSHWEPSAGIGLSTTRLENQLLHLDVLSNIDAALSNSTRGFGVSRDTDHALWQSGIEAGSLISAEREIPSEVDL